MEPEPSAEAAFGSTVGIERGEVTEPGVEPRRGVAVRSRHDRGGEGRAVLGVGGDGRRLEGPERGRVALDLGPELRIRGPAAGERGSAPGHVLAGRGEGDRFGGELGRDLADDERDLRAQVGREEEGVELLRLLLPLLLPECPTGTGQAVGMSLESGGDERIRTAE
jgi:hypothetical protein